jgi:hypothetical protein
MRADGGTVSSIACHFDSVGSQPQRIRMQTTRTRCMLHASEAKKLQKKVELQGVRTLASFETRT